MKKYISVSNTIAIISGRILAKFIFMTSVLFSAVIACEGVMNPWIDIGYPAIEKRASLFRGNAAPVKNINRNIGKLPATNTSLLDFVAAAMIRLNAIIERQVKPVIRSIIANDPSYRNPSSIAVSKVSIIDIIPTAS